MTTIQVFSVALPQRGQVNHKPKEGVEDDSDESRDAMRQHFVHGCSRKSACNMWTSL
ncbi:hypothetical protein CY34DRAFT_803149 [Suillus luteus UH-Slu-Lm8-n1]|uniref:Uncharacterized protein n=1 Tax=Suillus luteus UH-Slu-Lm8-n1 TaxID=930992 RepID=A0A0D0BL94_9AGAM|nr:hypothetical protein CY34DRAFT_803149 [Suillus luteus UH-Slu-Lm8-n1]